MDVVRLQSSETLKNIAMPTKDTPHLLIVDDDAGQRGLVNTFLTGQGFRTTMAASGEEALEALGEQRFSMMISDVRMPGLSGLETLRRLREQHPSLPVMLVTAFPEIRDAVAAMKDGALNYLQKPIDLDALLAGVRAATGASSTAAPSAPLDLLLPDSVVARSESMRRVYRDARLVAESESRILITGESGVGKEVLADIIHGWSRRSGGPFVKINCAAIPESLLESELFGHAKGAFTGASAERVGLFEEANNGTIMLDEVGEMSASVQSKLLRVTQNGSFTRVGSNVERRTNARILGATNRDLEKEVADGRFREDLFYRLNVMELYLPPLRERREDILPLAEAFAAEFSEGAARLSAELTTLLSYYRWPGNVRELRNAMERAVLMSRGELLLPDHLPPRIRAAMAEASGPVATEGVRLAEMERDAILRTLREKRYNRTETARALGISRRSLTYKIQALKAAGFQVSPA